MTIIKCDRCKQEMRDTLFDSVKAKVEITITAAHDKTSTYDLCGVCAKDFMIFLKYPDRLQR